MCVSINAFVDICVWMGIHVHEFVHMYKHEYLYSFTYTHICTYLIGSIASPETNGPSNTGKNGPPNPDIRTDNDNREINIDNSDKNLNDHKNQDHANRDKTINASNIESLNKNNEDGWIENRNQSSQNNISRSHSGTGVFGARNPLVSNNGVTGASSLQSLIGDIDDDSRMNEVMMENNELKKQLEIMRIKMIEYENFKSGPISIPTTSRIGIMSSYICIHLYFYVSIFIY